MTRYSTPSTTPPKGRRQVARVAVLAFVGAALFALLHGGCQSETSGRHTTVLTAAASSYPIPTFGRPEEARRYFDAMIEGDTRAIELLDTALTKAKSLAGTDPEQVQKLEALRADRAVRLAAHQAARP